MVAIAIWSARARNHNNFFFLFLVDQLFRFKWKSIAIDRNAAFVCDIEWVNEWVRVFTGKIRGLQNVREALMRFAVVDVND